MNQIKETRTEVYTIDEQPDLSGYTLTFVTIEKRDAYYISLGFEQVNSSRYTHRLKLKAYDVGVKIVANITPFLGEKVKKIEYINNNMGIRCEVKSGMFEIF